MVDLVTNNCSFPLTVNMSNLHDDTLESSDSDDELLGITNDPICLKTFYKPSATLNPEENFQNHPRQTKTPHNTSDNSSQDGWIYCGKPRNNRKQPNQWSKSPKGSRLPLVIKSNPVDNISMNSWLASKEIKPTRSLEVGSKNKPRRKLSEQAKQIEIQNIGVPPGVNIKQSSLCEEATATHKAWNNICNESVTPTMEVINVSTQQSHHQGFHTMNERDQHGT